MPLIHIHVPLQTDSSTLLPHVTQVAHCLRFGSNRRIQEIAENVQNTIKYDEIIFDSKKKERNGSEFLTWFHFLTSHCEEQGKRVKRRDLCQNGWLAIYKRLRVRFNTRVYLIEKMKHVLILSLVGGALLLVFDHIFSIQPFVLKQPEQRLDLWVTVQFIRISFGIQNRVF